MHDFSVAMFERTVQGGESLASTESGGEEPNCCLYVQRRRTDTIKTV